MKKVKIITSIYSNLYGTEFGGRMNRNGHYKYSLLSLLKMSDADFVCYTSESEYQEITDFFYAEHNINPSKLNIKIFNLADIQLSKIIKKYKNIEETKKSDRCIEVQYMKYLWFMEEDLSYDYYYWFDAGLSHCGLIPDKYLNKVGNYYDQNYSSSLFNNKFLQNVIDKSENRFLIVTKENQRNYWSGTVNPCHFINHDSSRHVIGGFFGGKRELWTKLLFLFTKYVYEVSENDKRLYHEEDIMVLMYRNHPELFTTLEFDTWWHENERIAGLDMNEHLKINKSFYKILEELNNIYE